MPCLKYIETVAPVPEKIDTTFDGTNQWITNSTIKDKNTWAKDDAWTATADDSSEPKYLQVKGIKYTSPDGKTEKDKDLGTDTSKIEDAGTYSVTVAMKNIRWKGGTTGEKTFLINVAQKDVGTLTPTVDYGKEEDGITDKKYYSGTTTSGFPTLNKPKNWSIAGELKWDDDQTLGKTGNYNWTFTPDDDNYAKKQGSSPITVTAVTVSKIEAELVGTDPIYTSTKKEDLLKRITVKKTYNNSTEPVAADATTEIEITSTLEAGTNKKITLKYKDSNPAVTCELEIPEILAVKPAELVITHDGTTVYTSTSLDDLKNQLTVKVKNNDGSMVPGSLAATDYTFPEGFALADGDNEIELSYKFGTAPDEETIKGKVTITVGTASVKSVKVTPKALPDGVTLWEGAAANTIKEYLTVEVTFADGNDTKKTLDPKKDNFTVTVIGSADNVLTAGQCAFTVTYGGKTSSAQTVTVTELLVETLTATYVQAGRTIYSSATEDDLQIDTYLSVNAVFNNGDDETLDSSEYTVSIPKNFSSENNTVTVTWTKGETTKTTTFTVKVTDVAISGVEAKFELPAGKKITAANGLDDLKEYVTATLKYNNGDTKELKAADYDLEAETDGLQGSGNLKAGERTITLKYDDETTATFTVTVDKAEVDAGGINFAPAGGGDGGDLKPSTGGNGGFSGTYKPDGDFGIGIDPDSLPTGVTPKEAVYKKWTGKGEPTYDPETGKPTGSGWTPLPAGEKPSGAGTYVAEIDFDYDDENYNPIDPISTVIDIGKADVDMGGSTVKPAGGSDSGLKPAEGGNGFTGTYTDGGNYDIDVELPEGAEKDGAPVYKKLKEDGNPESEADWEVVDKPDGAGTYKVVVNLKPTDGDNYNDIDPIETILTLSEAKKGLDLPTIDDIVFSNALVSIADKLGGSYAEHKDIITLGGVYDGVKNAGVYTATLTLTDDNYYWNESSGTQTNAKKVTFAGGTFTVNGQVATLTWRITPYILTAENWALTGKDGAVYNLPAALTDGLDVGVNYLYFEEKTAEAMEGEVALTEGAQYFVKAELFGTDAYNFVFDGTLTSTSDFADYTVPAGFLASAISFLKANWLWFVIGAAALLFLIILICVIAAAKKKKKRRLAEEKAEKERKLAEEKEEKERKEEERRQREDERRREEREERMMRMNQQAMPQMMMPQMMPQMQMPQQQSQPMSQTVQPVMGGGSANEIAELKAEMAAMRATQDMTKELALRAEMAAKESAMRAEQNAVLRSDVNALRGDNSAFVNGQSMTGMTAEMLAEIVSAAVEKVLDRREKPVQQTAPATTDNGSAPAATQVPPDAVMTTVTTTKIDTTKKAQNGQGNAQAPRQTRSFVPPMPVDDGRVFDVGGFYKPADPIDLVGDEDEEAKK